MSDILYLSLLFVGVVDVIAGVLVIGQTYIGNVWKWPAEYRQNSTMPPFAGGVAGWSALAARQANRFSPDYVPNPDDRYNPYRRISNG